MNFIQRWRKRRCEESAINYVPGRNPIQDWLHKKFVEYLDQDPKQIFLRGMVAKTMSEAVVMSPDTLRGIGNTTLRAARIVK